VNPEKWFSYANEKYMWAIGRSSAAHSIYFQVLGQHGFVAAILFIALLIATMLSLGRTKRRALLNPDTAWVANYASGIQVALAGYMVCGAFLSSAYFDLAWLFVALSAILAREVAPARKGIYSPATGAALGAISPAATQFAAAPAAAPRSGAYGIPHAETERR
jgi:O-antigen ligase